VWLELTLVKLLLGLGEPQAETRGSGAKHLILHGQRQFWEIGHDLRSNSGAIRGNIVGEDSFMSEDANEFVAEGEYEPSETNSVVTGFALLLIGFAAGAIVAALMTPKTGKQMRRHLKRTADDLRDRVGDWSDQAGDWVEKGSGLADKASEWADAAKDKVGPLAKKFRS
jgi:gas vesicle protein